MTSFVSASNSFSSLTSPGDAIAVLVLVETSGNMLNFWDEIKAFYLPVLLDTLRDAHDSQTVPMRVCWQTSQTIFSGNQMSSVASHNTGDTGKEIPDFQIDPASTSTISTTALRYSIETLKAAFRDQHATRHFILVAATPPIDDQTGMSLQSGALRSIATALLQERIRFHMVLGSNQYIQPYHQLHQQVLRLQSCPAVPLWFRADSSRFNILLMGKSLPSPVEGVSSLSSGSSVASGSSQSSGTSLPSSPILKDPLSADRRKSVSPQTRRGRTGTADQAPHGLVSYLQQMHGLTKKRTYGGAKSTKRSSTSDAPRHAPSSTRPILPRLDLSDPRSRGFAPYPISSPTSERPTSDKAALSSQPRYLPIAPASSPNSPSDDGRRSRSRWPWLQPAPMPSLSSGPSSATTSAANALRSLAMMAPRPPGLAARLPDLSPLRGESAATVNPRAEVPRSTEHGRSLPPDSSAQPQREPADWYYRQRSSTIATSTPADHRMSATPSPTHTPHTPHAYDPSWMQGHYQQPLHGYPTHDHLTPTHEHGYYAYTHMTPPISRQESVSDAEDQPFLITPEFEALANARFDEAVRSGAMQASMTAATLGPVANPPAPSNNPADFMHSSPGETAPMNLNEFPQPSNAVYGNVSYIVTQPHPPGPNGPVYQVAGDRVSQLPPSGQSPAQDPTQSRWYGL